MDSAKAPRLLREAPADHTRSHDRDRRASPIMMDESQTEVTAPRRRDINLLPTWVYYCETESGDQLYVGVTCNLHHRLSEHKDSKWWWPEVEYVQAYLYPDREQAMTWEACHIRRWRPKYNREIPPQPVIPAHWDANYDSAECLDLYADEVA